MRQLRDRLEDILRRWLRINQEIVWETVEKHAGIEDRSRANPWRASARIGAVFDVTRTAFIHLIANGGGSRTTTGLGQRMKRAGCMARAFAGNPTLYLLATAVCVNLAR